MLQRVGRAGWVFLSALAAGCAAASGHFDDRFDPSWMNVILVDRSALPGFCLRLDLRHVVACAQPPGNLRSGAVESPSVVSTEAKPLGNCNIYMARDLIRDSEQFNDVLRHEAKHCRGWRHARD